MGDDDPVDDRDASSGDWHRDKGTENAAEGSATEGSDDNKCSRHGYGAGHDSRREYVGLLKRPGFGGGSQLTEDKSHGSTEEVPGRVA